MSATDDYDIIIHKKTLPPVHKPKQGTRKNIYFAIIIELYLKKIILKYGKLYEPTAEIDLASAIYF